MDSDDLQFQQDGAPCYTVHATIDLLSVRQSCYPPFEQCQLATSDGQTFFVKWYANNPLTIQAVKVNIEQAIREIEPEIVTKFLKNWIDMMRYFEANRGRHMNEIVFHK